MDKNKMQHLKVLQYFSQNKVFLPSGSGHCVRLLCSLCVWAILYNSSQTTATQKIMSQQEQHRELTDWHRLHP